MPGGSRSPVDCSAPPSVHAYHSTPGPNAVQREWMNSGVRHYRDWSLNPVEWIAIWLDVRCFAALGWVARCVRCSLLAPTWCCSQCVPFIAFGVPFIVFVFAVLQSKQSTPQILSIPQSNRGVQKLAVDSLYVYAAAVSALVIIAPDSKHESTGDDAGLESYKSRVCMAWL